MESIKAYHAAGAPVTLPSWASLQVYGSNSGGSVENPEVAPLAPAARSGAGIGDTSGRMVSDGGTFKVPVTINGQLIDSTSPSIAAHRTSGIPADVFMTLARTGTITDADYLDKQIYALADGSTHRLSGSLSARSVGNKSLDNVVGSIAPVKGSLLLGQSFLGRFNS